MIIVVLTVLRKETTMSMQYDLNNNEEYEQPYDSNDVGNSTTVRERRDINVTAPIGFSFSRTFKNGAFWLASGLIVALLTFIFMTVSIIPQLVALNSTGAAEASAAIMQLFLNGIIMIVMIPISIILLRQGLREVGAIDNDYQTVLPEKTPAQWGTLFKDISWGKVILTSIIVIAITGLLGGLIGGLFGALAATVSGSSAGGLLVFLLGLVVYLGMIALIVMLQYSVYFATDTENNARLTATQCVKASWKTVSQNFWKVVGFDILLGLVNFILIVFTIGIGMIVAIPVSILAHTHMYKQISGQYVPIKQ